MPCIYTANLYKRHVGIKLIQLIIGIICVCLFRFGYYWSHWQGYSPILWPPIGTVNETYHVAITLFGNFVYTTITLMCHLSSEEGYPATKVQCAVNLLAVIFYLSSALIVFNCYSVEPGKDSEKYIQAMALGVFCALNGVAYGMDGEFMDTEMDINLARANRENSLRQSSQDKSSQTEQTEQPHDKIS